MDPDRYLLTFRVSLRTFSLALSRVLVDLRVLHNQPVAPRSLIWYDDVKVCGVMES